jgi:DNA-binding winged helix-turn-helix (wHTH) protein/tetratricopeptide (TPR) repeat protein
MQPPSSRYYEFGPFRVDTAKRVLLREGQPVSLSPKAFDTLLMLVQHAGEVLEKDRLMDLLWPDSAVEEANLPLNVSALRKALGETPSERRYITTIPGRGYRFGAAVQVLNAEEPDIVIERHQRATVSIREHDGSGIAERSSSERLLPGAASPKRWKRAIVIVAAVGLLGTVLAALSFRRGVEEQTSPILEEQRSPPLVKSLAVLPVKPLDETSGDQLLGLGIADSLITRLSNLREVIVRPTSSVSRPSLKGKPPVDIGQELKVEAVLESWYQRSDGKIRLTVHLLRVPDGSHLWSDNFVQKETELFALEDTFSERVAAALIPRLTGEQKRILAQRDTENSEAHDLYIRGRAFWRQRTAYGHKKALEHFKQAIEKDPNYARAYSGLADSYRVQVEMPQREVLRKAKDNALTALAIDDNLAEAHVSLAMIMMQYDLDWPGADREFKRALDLDPNYTYGHTIYAHYLSLCGRFEEAAAEIKRAKELDPVELLNHRVEGYLFYLQGDFDQAIRIFRAVLEMQPDFTQALREIALAYEQKGMYEEAVEALKRNLSLPANYGKTTSLADLGHIYAVWGKRSKALKILDELKEKSKRSYVSPNDIAIIYVGLGEKEQALEWLEKAYEDRSYWLPRIKVDPRLDNLRSDPRFIELVRKVGF